MDGNRKDKKNYYLMYFIMNFSMIIMLTIHFFTTNNEVLRTILIIVFILNLTGTVVLLRDYMKYKSSNKNDRY